MEIFKEEPNVLRLQAPITSESLGSLEVPRLPNSCTDQYPTYLQSVGTFMGNTYVAYYSYSQAVPDANG